MASPFSRLVLTKRFAVPHNSAIALRTSLSSATPRTRIQSVVGQRSFSSKAFPSSSGSRVRLLVAGASIACTLWAADSIFANGSSSTVLLDDSKSRLAKAHSSNVAQEDESFKPYRPLQNQSWRSLINGYIVFTLCSSPKLVNVSPSLIDWSANTSIPFVKQLTEWIIRSTFFSHFISGETAEGSLPVLSALSRDSLGAMLNYSVEVSDDASHGKEAQVSSEPQQGGSKPKAAVHRPFVDELIHSIDVAADFAKLPSQHGAKDDSETALLADRPDRSGSTFVAIKLSGLLYDSSVLERASAAIVPREWFSSPPEPLPPATVNANGPCGGLAIPVAALSPTDVAALKQLWEALREVTLRAKQHGNVRIAVDAEYSWYQPAIDTMYEAIAAEFNKPGPVAKQGQQQAHQGHVSGPLVYNTFQTYLRRTPSHLAASFERAKINGYTLGVKLVRGAYVDIENKTWSEKIVDAPPVPKGDKKNAAPLEYQGWGSPVWPTKELTDRCFDGCAIRLVEEVYNDMIQSQKKGTPPKLAVIFASHNMQSALKVVRKMTLLGMARPKMNLLEATRKSGVEEDNLLQAVPLIDLDLQESVRGRIFLAQLYGMASAVTCRLQATFDPQSGGIGPHMVLKYIPYGPLELVMPYLVRRAVENGSVMTGGSAIERSLILDEVFYRLGFKH